MHWGCANRVRVFRQMSKDDIGGGVYILKQILQKGLKLHKLVKREPKVVVLSLVNESARQSQTAFENFRQKYKLHPNLSGNGLRDVSHNVAKKMVVEPWRNLQNQKLSP